MKKLKNYFGYMAILAMVFSSCSKEETTDSSKIRDGETATLSLGAILNQAVNKAATKQSAEELPDCSGTEPAWAYISLAYDTDGADDTDGYDETLEVTVGISEDETGYFTLYDDELEIPIPQGETSVAVRLVDFWVYNDVPDPLNVDAPGTVIWLAPQEGSDFAAFVDDPLPIDFDLMAGSKNYQDVEVLCFDNREVNKFGYQFFDIHATEMIQFCIFGNYCPPSGRHYTASYMVEVWEMNGEMRGDQLYTEIAEIEVENGVPYAEPLCFYLPDGDELDEYWFEITILDAPQYDVVERVILEGSISDLEIRELYNDGTDGEPNDDTLEYYHFQYGCGGDNPPPFYDPEVDAEHFKTCLYSAEGSDAVGFAYFTKEGTSLRADILGFGLSSGEDYPIFLHEGDDCESVGEVLWEFDLPDGSSPVADSYGKIDYMRMFDLTAAQANSLNLDDRTLTLNSTTGGDISPVACGEIMEN